MGGGGGENTGNQRGGFCVGQKCRNCNFILETELMF